MGWGGNLLVNLGVGHLLGEPEIKKLIFFPEKIRIFAGFSYGAHKLAKIGQRRLFADGVLESGGGPEMLSHLKI